MIADVPNKIDLKKMNKNIEQPVTKSPRQKVEIGHFKSVDKVVK